jgi:hypothetical protein
MIETTHTKERRRLRAKCAEVANIATRLVARAIPKNAECQDAFEQWRGAQELFFKYAEEKDDAAFGQARAYLGATLLEFRQTLTRHGALPSPTQREIQTVEK